jgi:hypothetical protein
MNQERLNALTARAERARQLACQIKELTDADPYRAGYSIRFQNSKTDYEVLNAQLAVKVMAEGRLKVLADMEAELEALINVEPEPSK